MRKLKRLIFAVNGMTDFIIELKPQRKVDKKGMAYLKHPIQASMRRSLRFGQPTVQMNTDQQILIVNDFQGGEGDLSQFVNMLAKQAGIHRPQIPINPQIERLPDGGQPQMVDSTEPNEEIEALQYTMDTYLAVLDQAEQQNHWYATEIQRLEEVRSKEHEFISQVDGLKTANADLERTLADSKEKLATAQKINESLKESYDRARRENKRFANQIINLEDTLERKLESTLAEAKADTTQIKINEVAESASVLRAYEKKLVEQGLDDPQEVIRVASLSLLDYVNAQLRRGFQTEEQVKSAANFASFEETDFYKSTARAYEVALKFIHFLKQDPAMLPEPVRQIYDAEKGNSEFYEKAVSQFENERAKHISLKSSAEEVVAAIKDHERAKSLLSVVQNPPAIRMHIISIKDHEELYVPTGEADSVLSESSIKAVLPIDATLNAGPNYLAIGLERGECTDVAKAIRDRINPVFSNVKITLEGEL